MSLNWNVGKIKGWKASGKMVADCDNGAHDSPCLKCPKIEEKLVHDAAGKPIPWAITNALIWACMGFQMSSITEKNAEEFAVRLALWQRVHGPYLRTKDGEPRPITTAEVLAHVGLSTNVTQKPRSYFLKTLGQSIQEEVHEELKEAREPRKPRGNSERSDEDDERDDSNESEKRAADAQEGAAS